MGQDGFYIISTWYLRVWEKTYVMAALFVNTDVAGMKNGQVTIPLKKQGIVT